MPSRILFIDTVHPLLEQRLTAAGYQCTDGSGWDRHRITAEINTFHGVVIRSRIKLDAELLSKATALRFIARAGAGMENIDAAAAAKKHIACLNAPEGNRDAVAEHTLGMILALFNNLCRADRQVRDGKWIREGNRGIEMQGKTIALIGYGYMGKAFALRLSGMGVTTLAYDKYKNDYIGPDDRHVTETSMERIFDEADIISFHVPLTEETRLMVNDAYINKFRKNIYLVNTARGPVINTADLVKNMKKGKVAGACMDVLEYESLSFENLDARNFPEPFQYLIRSDKVVLSPHIAGWTHESNEKLAQTLWEKIRRSEKLVK